MKKSFSLFPSSEILAASEKIIQTIKSQREKLRDQVLDAYIAEAAKPSFTLFGRKFGVRILTRAEVSKDIDQGPWQDAWAWNHRLNKAAAMYQDQLSIAVALKTLAEHSDWIMVTAEDFEAIASAI